MTTMDDIPKEILMKIFSFLTDPAPSLDNLYHEDMCWPYWNQDFLSLCNAALVSRVWRQVGEDPSLWKRFVLVVHSTSDLATLDTITKFSRVQRLVVKEVGECHMDRLRRLVEDKHIDTVFCTRWDFERLGRNQDFFKRVTQLKHFIVYEVPEKTVDEGSIRGMEIWKLFGEIANSLEEGKSKLRSLSVYDIIGIDPILLGKVVGGLEMVDLGASDLWNDEVEAVVDAVLESTSLKMAVFGKWKMERRGEEAGVEFSRRSN